MTGSARRSTTCALALAIGWAVPVAADDDLAMAAAIFAGTPGGGWTQTEGWFTGSGDYEGLTAYVVIEDLKTIRGYLIEGQLPPPPEPVTAE